MPQWLNPKLWQQDNGTTLRHVYKSGKYEGDVVTAHVQGERINISGDADPDNSFHTTRTPPGAAREAARRHRDPRTKTLKGESMEKRSSWICPARFEPIEHHTNYVFIEPQYSAE